MRLAQEGLYSTLNPMDMDGVHMHILFQRSLIILWKWKEHVLAKLSNDVYFVCIVETIAEIF